MEVRNQDEIGLISPCITGSNPVSTERKALKRPRRPTGSSYNMKTLATNCCEGHFFFQTKKPIGVGFGKALVDNVQTFLLKNPCYVIPDSDDIGKEKDEETKQI